MSQDSVRTRLTTPTWCRRLPNTWVVLDNKGGSRREKNREKEKEKKGNTLNKLLPLLWSSNRGRRTALPSALNKHCGPTTTYKAGLDVRACKLEGRGVSRRWARERGTPPTVADTKLPESLAAPAELKQVVPPAAASPSARCEILFQFGVPAASFATFQL